jgi:putative pyruvate formate lyase activating enzyme
MYLSVESMKLLFGTQDVYLTDFKYGDDRCALRLSKVPNYFEVVARNHRLAFADAELIIRQLVLPNHVECCTRRILRWIFENLGAMVRTNVMSQYRPCYRASEHEDINRRLSEEEFSRALRIAEEVGLENVIS